MARLRPTRKLQARGPAPAILERLFAQKCASMSLLPGMRASSVGSETARLKPGSTPPPRVGAIRTVAEWRDEWEECETNEDRLKLIARMDRVLRANSGDRDMSKRRGTREWKLRVATDTRASALVGLEYGISPSRVRQLRMDFIAGRLS